MKTNKFFATALAVLALAGFTACDQPTPTEPLELTETSVTLKVGETHQLTANVAVESWTSSNEAVATVADGLVTAVSAGNAIISATAAGVTKTCVVLVDRLSSPNVRYAADSLSAQRGNWKAVPNKYWQSTY